MDDDTFEDFDDALDSDDPIEPDALDPLPDEEEEDEFLGFLTGEWAADAEFFDLFGF